MMEDNVTRRSTVSREIHGNVTTKDKLIDDRRMAQQG